MGKSMDRVPQADGTYKWELVDVTQDYLKERAAKEEALRTGTPFPGSEPEPKKTVRRSKVSKVDESTNF
jgi:hypothetical protein